MHLNKYTRIYIVNTKIKIFEKLVFENNNSENFSKLSYNWVI